MKEDLGPVVPLSLDLDRGQLDRGQARFDPWKSHLKIIVRGLKTNIMVGLHPWETHPERPTPVIVDVELFAQGEEAGDSAATIIDYDPIRDLVTKQWPKRPHTPLLETWVEELVAFCFAMPRVDACRVSIVKPHIFPEADGVGVEVFRVRPARPKGP